tara:strand:- start:1 stop:279 length:279 start_codon:yes stop_codon:yes gene_type:complete
MNNIKNKTFKLIIKTAISKTGDNAVLLDLESGKYFDLNDVALLIVENLYEHRTFKEIKDIVLNSYNITESECDEDILSFLQNLIERDFLEVI